MSRLRRLFYVGMITDVVGFVLLGGAALYLFPSKWALAVYAAVAFPSIMWHQSYIRRQMNCPSCKKSLYEWDGIALHAKTCLHCGVDLK